MTMLPFARFLNELPRGKTKVSLDNEDIHKIAWLARLQIEEADSPKYADELSQVLDLVDQLN